MSVNFLGGFEMEQTVSITVVANNHGAILLRGLADAIAGDNIPVPRYTAAFVKIEESQAEAGVEVEKQKRHRRTKAEIEAAKTSPEEPDKEVEAVAKEVDLGFETEPVKAEAPKLTIEKDIIPAFKKFAGTFADIKVGRTKAAEVLAKYNCSSVQQIPPEKFSQLLKELRV